MKKKNIDVKENVEILEEDVQTAETVNDKENSRSVENYIDMYYKAYKNDYITQYYNAYKEMKAKEEAAKGQQTQQDNEGEEGEYDED